MRLSDVCENRDNNFNLIRFFAAAAVLISHSFPLSNADLDDPLIGLIGMSAGNIAVDIFFLSSGFLVTRSLLVSQSIKTFLRARALRIYPALWVMLLITVFAFGPLTTESKLIDYFTDPMTWKYLIRNATMILPAKHDLPGVFLDNPYGRAVNGSLWTLPFEIKLYIGLALLMRIFTTDKVHNFKYLKIAIILLACTLTPLQIIDHYIDFNVGQALRLSGFFFSGGAFYISRNQVALKYRYLFAIIIAMASTLIINEKLFFIIYSLGLTWLMMHLVYIPKKIIRNYNNMGDYSYGIYIYAFPIQQLTILTNPNISTNEFIFISLLLTFIFSIFSWHAIEKPSLKYK